MNTNIDLKKLSEERKERASEVLNRTIPERVDETTYLIPSSDGKMKYKVVHLDAYSCECPDYQRRCKDKGLYCKHINAIILFNKLKNRVDIEGFDVEGITDEKACPSCKSEKTAEKYVDNWRTYYNFIRPHIGLNGLTPSQVAGIDLGLERNRWLSLLKLSADNNSVQVMNATEGIR